MSAPARLGGGRPWRARLARALAALLIANAALFAAYTAPRVLRGRSLARQQRALADSLTRERAALGRVKQRAETVRANARDLERFYSEVVKDKSSVPALLEALDGAAPSAGNRSFQAEQIKGLPVGRVVVTMPIRGSYAQLVGFLQRLETFPYFVTVDQVRLQQRDDGADLSVQVSGYFRSGAAGGSRGR